MIMSRGNGATSRHGIAPNTAIFDQILDFRGRDQYEFLDTIGMLVN